MNSNFQVAIIEFLANELHIPSDTLTVETNFKLDLSLNEEETSNLLQRLQDALNFTIPDEKISEIESIGDIIQALTPEKSDYDPSS